MTDRRERELERRLAAGDPAAEVELLRTWVRSGRLDTDRVELLAHLCYEPAWAALEWGEPEVRSDHLVFHRAAAPDTPWRVSTEARPWAKALRRWMFCGTEFSRQVAMRIVVAVARAAARVWVPYHLDLWKNLGAYEPGGPGWVTFQVKTVLELADALVVCDEAGAYPARRNAVLSAAQLLRQRCTTQQSVGTVAIEWKTPRFVWLLGRAMFNDTWLAELVAVAEEFLGESCVPTVSAARAELAPWILGRSDPVQERVDAWEAGVRAALESKEELVAGGGDGDE